jgi:hypothetical protein
MPSRQMCRHCPFVIKRTSGSALRPLHALRSIAQASASWREVLAISGWFAVSRRCRKISYASENGCSRISLAFPGPVGQHDDWGPVRPLRQPPLLSEWTPQCQVVVPDLVVGIWEPPVGQAHEIMSRWRRAGMSSRLNRMDWASVESHDRISALVDALQRPRSPVGIVRVRQTLLSSLGAPKQALFLGLHPAACVHLTGALDSRRTDAGASY